MRAVDLLIVRASEVLPCLGPPGGVRRPGALDVIHDGAVAIDEGRVVEVGPSQELERRYRGGRTLDASGRLVTPGLIDAHTHLVHGGSRHQEWAHRVAGTPWDGPAGIDATVQATRRASDDELRRRAIADLDVALAHGTTTLEAKSGYGLDPATELRLLRLTARLDHPVDVVPTYLGAHVVPRDRRDDREGYLRDVIELLPAARELAPWCDVWCDPAAFTSDEAARVLRAAGAAGFDTRLHADQTGDAGGVRLAVELGAASVDHLDETPATDLVALGASDAVAVLLPGCTLHLLQAGARDWPAWARRIIDSGAVVAIATDYNPGSCPTISLPEVMGLAARLYRLRIPEIWYGVTLNAAAALRLGDRAGSLAPGRHADVVVWSVPEHAMVVHRFGTNLVETVVRRGDVVVDGGRRTG